MLKTHGNACVKARIPQERYEWIKRRAADNGRSINAEINFILDRFKALEESGRVPKVA